MNNIKFFKAWILFFLVATIGGFVVGAILGFALTIMNGGDPSIVEQNRLIFQVISFLLSMPISYFVYRWTVTDYIVPQVKESLVETNASVEKS